MISSGDTRKWPQGFAECHAQGERFFVDPFPHPGNTRGEARMIGRLAGDKHWNRVVVVTSRYHVTRARLLIRRCTPADVRVVAARPHRKDPQLFWKWAREWGGLAVAVVRRGC